MNKINAFVLSFFIMCSSVFAADYSFFSMSLLRIDFESQTPLDILPKEETFKDLKDAILTFMCTDIPAADFYGELRAHKTLIESIAKQSLKVRPESKYNDQRPFELFGEKTVMFRNTFSHKKIPSAADYAKENQQEWSNYNKYKLCEATELTDSTLALMQPGIDYNYVLNIHYKSFFSPEQQLARVNIDPKYGSKPLLTPNHTILSNNYPLLTAGNLQLYRYGDKQVVFITNSSGHFKPTYKSLKHMKNYLVSIGVPEESIICLTVTVDKMAWKAMK